MAAPAFGESAMCCYSCRAFEDVFWPPHLRAVAHTTTPHRGDSPPFCPVRCGSYLPFVVSLSPVSLPAAPSVRPVLVNSVRSSSGALCFRHSPSATLRLSLPEKKKKKKKEMQARLSRRRLGFFGGMPNGAGTTGRSARRANPPRPICPLGIVQARRRQTDEGENILSIYRILAARRHFALAVM